MRKPSIFSRDYEKRMKKRKKILAAIYILVFLMLGFTAAIVTTKSYDFTNLRNRIQAWIDSGNTKVEESGEEVKPEVEPEPKEDIRNIEIKLLDNRLIVCEYEEKDGVILYKVVKSKPEGIEVTISPNKQNVLVVDEKQNIKIFNTKSEEIDLTKTTYTSPSGETFTKDKTLETYKEYFWSKEAKFINDEKIAYISNVPYFGYDLNKYIWIIDLKSKEHNTLWNSKGKDVKLLEIKEKGLEISIDNNVKYLDNNGNIIN